MLKIWGRTNSVNVKKVLWCADELGVKYERKASIDPGEPLCEGCCGVLRVVQRCALLHVRLSVECGNVVC